MRWTCVQTCAGGVLRLSGGGRPWNGFLGGRALTPELVTKGWMNFPPMGFTWPGGPVGVVDEETPQWSSVQAGNRDCLTEGSRLPGGVW